MGLQEEFAARATAIDAVRAEVAGDRERALALLGAGDPSPGEVISALLAVVSDVLALHAQATGRAPGAVLDQLAAPPAMEV